jgi:hypothetical protein
MHRIHRAQGDQEAGKRGKGKAMGETMRPFMPPALAVRMALAWVLRTLRSGLFF